MTQLQTSWRISKAACQSDPRAANRAEVHANRITHGSLKVPRPAEASKEIPSYMFPSGPNQSAKADRRLCPHVRNRTHHYRHCALITAFGFVSPASLISSIPEAGILVLEPLNCIDFCPLLW